MTALFKQAAAHDICTTREAAAPDEGAATVIMPRQSDAGVEVSV